MATFNRRGYKNSKSNLAQKGEKSQTAEVFESLDSTANKSEQWILKNQNMIFTIIAVISVSVLSSILKSPVIEKYSEPVFTFCEVDGLK